MTEETNIPLEILTLLRDHGPLTASDLRARLSHISPTSINSAIYRLLDRDSIYRAGTRKTRKRGRPAVYLDVARPG